MPSLRLLSALLLGSCLLTAACSTPISPYSPLEDIDLDEDQPRDAGVTLPRDAGRRDAGPADASAGSSANCLRIAMTDTFGSFLDSDCSSRSQQACTGPGQSVQAAVNQRVTNIATRCGAPLTAAIGVSFGPTGCPATYGYSSALRGRVWNCIEAELETLRLGCSLSCALAGPLSR